MNRWNKPGWLETEVRARDKTCIYCGVRMLDKMPRRGPRKAVATWEHIINDASIVTRENVARCCAACNSSKGTKKLAEWFESPYCKQHGINKTSVADVDKQALKHGA
jgi:5-methylcytosine-specific restriction endonuclease McrA